MKNGLVELVIILDKSGSMLDLQEDVVGGYNSLIEKQKKYDGEVLVTTILFNHNIYYLNQRTNIKEIKKMKQSEYVPSGCTALLDAIGDAISFVKTKHSTLKEEEKPKKVIFSIMTDGLENSSKEYSYSIIKDMIEKQKKEGWDFLFQAANIDEVKEGTNLGIDIDDIVSFNADKAGVHCCFVEAGASIQRKMNKK